MQAVSNKIAYLDEPRGIEYVPENGLGEEDPGYEEIDCQREPLHDQTVQNFCTIEENSALRAAIRAVVNSPTPIHTVIALGLGTPETARGSTPAL